MRLWESSVDVPGPLVDRLVNACRTHHVYCVIDVNEREPGRSSSVFNTMLILGPRGLLARHRKMMPTITNDSSTPLGAAMTGPS